MCRTSLTSPIFSALLFAAKAAAAAILVTKEELETKKSRQALWLGLFVRNDEEKQSEFVSFSAGLRLATAGTLSVSKLAGKWFYSFKPLEAA